MHFGRFIDSHVFLDRHRHCHYPHSHRRRRIKAAATVRQFSANGDSHRAKNLRLTDEQPRIHYGSWRCGSLRGVTFEMFHLRLPHWQDGGCFMGGRSLKSQSGGLTVIYFHHKHLVSESFWVTVTDAVFLAEVWWRVGRTGERTEASPHISAVFFSSCKLPKTVTVTFLLLFGHGKLLCGTFLCIKDPFS